MSHKLDDAAGADRRGNLPLEIDESAITIREKIGEGGFGIVYHGEWQQKTVALKFIRKEGNSNEAELLQREGSLLWRYRHDNIIVLHGVCRFSEKTACELPEVTLQTVMNTLFVMECARGGSLEDVVNNYHADIQHDVRVDWATQLASGLKYLHDNHCVHRDLKADNVLIMEPITSSSDLRHTTLKISDFGLVGEGFKNTKESSRISGAWSWMPPEIYNKEKRFSKKSDVWCFGAVLHWIIYRRIPEFSEDWTLIFCADCEYNFDNILIGCLKSNHRSRPEIGKILEDLEGLKFPSEYLPSVAEDDASYTAGADRSGNLPLEIDESAITIHNKIAARTSPRIAANSTGNITNTRGTCIVNQGGTVNMTMSSSQAAPRTSPGSTANTTGNITNSGQYTSIQAHSVNLTILSNQAGTSGSESVLQQTFRRMLPDFERGLLIEHVKKLATYLYSKGQLSYSECETIKNKTDPQGARDALFSHIRARGDVAIQCFADALHDIERSDLANELCPREQTDQHDAAARP